MVDCTCMKLFIIININKTLNKMNSSVLLLVLFLDHSITITQDTDDLVMHISYHPSPLQISNINARTKTLKLEKIVLAHF